MSTVFKTPVRFDAPEVETLRAELDRLVSARGDVVVDLAFTEVIDASGVGALVYTFKRLAMSGARLSVRNVSGQPLDLLHASGLLRTLGSERPEGWLRAAVRRLRRDRIRTVPATASASIGAAQGVVVAEHTPERSKGAA